MYTIRSRFLLLLLLFLCFVNINMLHRRANSMSSLSLWSNFSPFLCPPDKRGAPRLADMVDFAAHLLSVSISRLTFFSADRFYSAAAVFVVDRANVFIWHRREEEK